ncbi:MAG: hypothetical protein J6Y20_05495 [Lachnospiraceae bacterium]|nr:hypothetical protein [Lachnospiraceae bacterium]
MKYLIICFAAGILIGSLAIYIFSRSRNVGSLLIYDDEESMTAGMGPSIFLELEVDLAKFRNKKNVKLRVENHSFYENQNT